MDDTLADTTQGRLDRALNGQRGDTRMAGRVTRYHTWPLLHRQDISQHSWQVWRIMRAIWGPQIPWDVTEQVLMHDVGELRTGDAPYPIKRDNLDLKAIMDRLEDKALAEQGVLLQPLAAQWRWRVKVAHTIEMMEVGIDEMQAGNHFGSTIIMQMAFWLAEQLHTKAIPNELQAGADLESRRVRGYVADRCARAAALRRTSGDAVSYLLNTARNPDYAPSPGQPGVEPNRSGTPDDGGHHGA